jgi:hypothetical protein
LRWRELEPSWPRVQSAVGGAPSRTQRVTLSPTAGLVKVTRASERGGRGKFKGTSNRIAIDHTSHTSQLINLAAHVTGSEPNTNLTDHNAGLLLDVVRAVTSLPGYLLTQGIER